MTSHFTKFLYRFILVDYGYSNWEEKLYSRSNLEKYATLLEEFHSFCKSHKIKLLFVLTPNNHDEYFKQQYSKLIPYLEKAKIEYLDLYPAIYRDLNKYKNKKMLWANGANGHPGDIVTTVYANEVFDYLERQGILRKHK